MNQLEDLAKRIRLGEDSALVLKQIVLAGGRAAGPSRQDLADELAALAKNFLASYCFVNIVGDLSTINLPIQWCGNDARRGLATFKSVPCGKYIFLQ